MPQSIANWLYDTLGIPLVLPYLASNSNSLSPMIEIHYEQPLYPKHFSTIDDMHKAYYDVVKQYYYTTDG
jgi:hypothetical protein